MNKITKVIDNIRKSKKASLSLLNENTLFSNSKILTDCKQLIILDSSFNPPTLAHFHLIKSAFFQVKQNHSINEIGILLLLSCNNVDKPNITGANIEQRLEMMSLFETKLQDEIKLNFKSPFFSGVGLLNVGKFVDKTKVIENTLNQYTHNNKNLIKRTYNFIMGYDTLIRFLNPKYYIEKNDIQSLELMENHLNPFFTFDNSRIIYTSREGYECNDELILKLLKKYDKFIDKIDLSQISNQIPLTEISSTMVRELVKKEKNNILNCKELKFLLCEEILKFIYLNHIYI